MKFPVGAVIRGNQNADYHYSITRTGTEWIVLSSYDTNLSIIQNVPCFRDRIHDLIQAKSQSVLHEKLELLYQKNSSQFGDEDGYGNYEVHSRHFDLIEILIPVPNEKLAENLPHIDDEYS